jgi:hypothetical protein
MSKAIENLRRPKKRALASGLRSEGFALPRRDAARRCDARNFGFFRMPGLF